MSARSPLSLVLILTLVSSAAAQPGRDRFRRESFDPADMIKRMDDNNNGMIEPSEISSRSREFVRRAAEKAKLSMDKPMPVSQLLPAMQQASAEFRQEQERRNAPSSSSSSTSPSGSSPGGSASRPTGGFGFGAAPAGPSGFGSSRAASAMSLEQRFDDRVIEYVNNMLREQDKNGDGSIDSVEWKSGRYSTPPEESDLNRDNKLSKEELCIRVSKKQGIPEKTSSSSTVSSAPASGSSSASRSSTGSSGDDYKSYAAGLLKQYDKSNDGMLQKDEWKEMKSEYHAADGNSDGTITLEELTSKVAARSSSAGPTFAFPSSSSSSSGSSGKKPFRFGGDKSASTDGKKSYRFLTPTERLPKGLPDWFLRNDADGDGQVLMAEYSSNWTEATAAEFARYDLDGDGIITPRECLAGEKK